MKVLVIPDVHGRKFWREAVENCSNQVEKVIFLGDYLDPYPNEINDNQELMECNDFFDCVGLSNMLNDIISLKKSEPDKFILLTGNHTDGYIWKGFNRATRTDRLNFNKYHNIFKENLNLFNLIFVENDTIFSHSGITKGWGERVFNFFRLPINSSLIDITLALQKIPLEDYDSKLIDLVSEISRYRGGDYIYGSCEWADLLEHIDTKNSKRNNIIPIGDDEVYQIFGHTQLKTPMINDKWACLDCRKAFIVDTVTHEIRSYDSL